MFLELSDDKCLSFNGTDGFKYYLHDLQIEKNQFRLLLWLIFIMIEGGFIEWYI